MVTSLSEMANKLQSFIIEQQSDAHNSSNQNLNMAKYNNIKLLMDETILYPHIIIRIGISEGIYDLKSATRTEGGLGPDERYVQKWIEKFNIISDLNEIYKSFRIAVESGGGGKDSGEADGEYGFETGNDGKDKIVYEARAVTNNRKNYNDEEEKEIKKYLKKYLKSPRHRF